ncbi:MAG TPA: hypothetical protein VGN18_19015 [Jatrophihabitans sp.]|jgi:hypothetical protein|uniref:hypothetical protein n=1 Tax=Jatrophihabitans sp. TaxID=1932789 RepID=UPI002E0716BE|nr:hypothetical protein [Jatrophihabitans sp.]
MSSAPAPRRHPRAYWSAVLLTVALIVGGTLVAIRSYLDSSGPDGVVARYFAALAAGDAPAALALGPVPDAPHTFLTSTVLRDQLGLAPIRDITVDRVEQHGATATVRVEYALAFRSGSVPVHDAVPTRLVGGTWQLARSAAATQLQVVRGADRATIAGGPIPDGTVGLFPGAVPIRFDTGYLELDPEHSAVTFAGDPTTQVFPRVSDAGERAVVAAVATALRRCLAGAADLRCPLPDGGRAVPGSVRGRLASDLTQGVSVDLADGAAGALKVTGDVKVHGSYRTLSFRNVTTTTTGIFTLPVLATTYARAPVVTSWDPPL